MSDSDRRFKTCPNCGNQLDEFWTYCPACGQENRDRIVSFRTLVLDFLGDYFTFDAKFFTSFGPLLFKPGRLTRDYLDGKQVRYIPPLRILIFSSIVYLFLLSIFIQNHPFGEFDQGFIAGLTEQGSAVDTLDEAGNVRFTFHEPSPGVSVFGPNGRQENEADRADENKADSMLGIQMPEGGILEIDTTGASGQVEFFRTMLSLIDSGYTDAEIADSLVVDSASRIRWKMVEQTSQIVREGGVTGLIRFMISNGTIAVLLALPFFALLLMLLYIRRKQFYVSHFIFATHYHAFVVALLLILHLIMLVSGYYAWWLLLLTFPYLLIAMRVVYRQGWIKTAIKMIILLFVYFSLFFPLFVITLGVVSFLLF